VCQALRTVEFSTGRPGHRDLGVVVLRHAV